MNKKYERIIGVFGIAIGILKIVILVFNLNLGIIASLLNVAFLALIAVVLIVNVATRRNHTYNLYGSLSLVLLLLFLGMTFFSGGTQHIRDILFTTAFTLGFVDFTIEL